MRAHIQLSGEILLGEEHLSLSVEAQLLDVLLNCEADINGRVVNPRRVCRGLGFDVSVLDELYASGVLLEVAGETFIRDTWVHNTYNARFTKNIEKTKAYQTGRLGFEGAPFRSAYVALGQSLSSQEQDNECSLPNSNNNATQRNVTEPNATDNTTAAGKNPCLCQRCGARATYSIDQGKTTIHCDKCGSYAYSTSGSKSGRRSDDDDAWSGDW